VSVYSILAEKSVHVNQWILSELGKDQEKPYIESDEALQDSDKFEQELPNVRNFLIKHRLLIPRNNAANHRQCNLM